MKQLLILSGKGGTGKTTLASSFIHLTRARACADCDVDAPNLHLVRQLSGGGEETPFMGGMKAEIHREACTACGLCARHCHFGAITMGAAGCVIDPYACEGCGVCQYICPAGAVALREDRAGTLRLYREDALFSTAELRMGRGNSGKLVTQVKMQLDQADAPLAIIDGSPGVGCPVIASMTGVDLALMVAEPSLSGLSDLKRILHTAAMLRTPAVVCINKYDLSPVQTEAVEACCREADVPVVGRIPYDPAVPAAINAGRCVMETPCAAGAAIKDVFEAVMRRMEAG